MYSMSIDSFSKHMVDAVRVIEEVKEENSATLTAKLERVADEKMYGNNRVAKQEVGRLLMSGYFAIDAKKYDAANAIIEKMQSL